MPFIGISICIGMCMLWYTVLGVVWKKLCKNFVFHKKWLLNAWVFKFWMTNVFGISLN